MKRSTTILMIGIITALYFAQGASAEEKASLTAAASSIYSSYYGADKAIDGNEETYWIGARYVSPWWIRFDTGSPCMIKRLRIKWYPYYYYVPVSYDIQVSDDGVEWEDVLTGLEGNPDHSGEERVIGRKARYLRLFIHSVNRYFPVIKELDCYVEYETMDQVIRFKGELTDTSGDVLDGVYDIQFRLYNEATGGESLWTETQQGVDIVDGVMDVELGSVTPFTLPFDEQYWLSVEVDSDGEMIPRFKLTSAPYAIKSAR